MALSSSQQKSISDYGKAYNDAKAKGDTAGMKAANTAANAVRNSAGLKAGVDYNPTTGAMLKSSSPSPSKATTVSTPTKTTSSGGGGSSKSSGISLRDAASSLGANVGFDAKTGQVTVNANGKNLSFGNGQGSQFGLGGNVNGSNMISDFDKFAQALGYSPVRQSAESRGLNVGWNPDNRSVSLGNKELGIENTLSPDSFKLGKNGRSYMAQGDLDKMFSDYDNVVSTIMQQQQQLQAPLESPLQAMIDQYMGLLQGGGQMPDIQMPRFDGQYQALQAGYDNKLRAIKGRLADGKESLEDKYFQNYLAARQGMANRGLAGSGLASDQDTRLLLAKQRDLAGLERDVTNAELDAADWFGSQQMSIADQEFNAQQTAMQKAQAAQADSQSKNMQLFGDLIKNLLPYEQAKVADYMKQNQFYDKLDQNGKQFADDLAYKYYNTDANIASKEKIAQNLNGWRYYNTNANYDVGMAGVGQRDLASQRTYDVGMNRNAITDAHYQRSDATAAQNADTNYENAVTNRTRANAYVQDLDAKAQQNIQKITDARTKQEATAATTLLTQAGQNLRKAMDSGDAGMVAEALKEFDRRKIALESIYSKSPATAGTKLPDFDFSTKGLLNSGFNNGAKGGEGTVAGKRGSGYGGMTKAVESEYNKLTQLNPGMKFMGGFNDRNVRGGNTKSMHAYGRAFDLGGTPQQMQKAANDATKLKNVQYVIYNRKIWSPSKGWQPYNGQSPHTDHVHVDFKS